MKPFPIMNVGEHGIISDLPDFQLPPNAWSDGENVRFFENRAMSAGGYDDAFTPSILPYFIDQVGSAGNLEFVYAGLDEIYTYDGASHTARTRNAGATIYTGQASDLWNGGVIHGYHALTNGVDSPQYRQIGSVNNYADMEYDNGAGTTWTDENRSCKLLIPMKYHLMAIDLDVNGTRYPRRLHWCNPVDPGLFPSDWDTQDPTNRAGHVDLVGGTDDVTAAEGMAEAMVIYTGDTAFRADWVGGAKQFDVNTLDWAQGAATQRSVCPLPGGYHFVVAKNDVYVHNGAGYESVIDEKTRDLIFNRVSSDNYNLLFVVPNYRKNEVMVCIPLSGDNECTEAHAFNYKRRSWSAPIAIPNLMAAKMLLDPQADATPWTWDSLGTATWNDMTFPWGGEGFNPLNRSVLAASPIGSGSIVRLGTGNLAGGSTIETRLERTGLNIGGGKSVVTVDRVIPKIVGGPVDIQVGGQLIPGGQVTWSGKITFDPSTDVDATFWDGASGVYNAIRFTSDANVSWELESVILIYHIRGSR